MASGDLYLHAWENDVMTDSLSRLLYAAVLVGSVLYLPAHVLADENGVSGALPATAPTMFGSAAISSDALDVFRGGTEVLNISKNDGIVGNNQAYNLTTGNNVITEGSLAGASGFSTVIQNSGNNVLIQNSTNINLQVK
jgi:hypothetical protein